MKTIQAIFTAFLVCFVSVGFAPAQKPSKEKSEKVTLTPLEVKANLTVLDANNKFVDDIKAEDLKIFEDGVEQKIDSIEKKNSARVGLVVDNTGSLRDQLGVILELSKAVVDNLDEQQKTFIVRFVSSDKIEITQEWTTDKTLLKAAIENFYIERGQSAILDAVYLAAQKFPDRAATDSSERNVIILVSDGDERDSYYKIKDVISELNRNDVQVFVVGLSRDLSDKKQIDTGRKNSKTNADNLMNLLALKTGGAAFYPNSKATDIEQSLKSIFTEAKSRYVVRYTSTNQKRNGLPRKLQITVANGANGEKRQAVARESFVVPKD